MLGLSGDRTAVSVSPATARSASRCGSACRRCVSVGVNLGVLPTKGLTLPLISSGGSSVLMTCAALGLLLRVSYELDRAERQVAKLRGDAVQPPGGTTPPVTQPPVSAAMRTGARPRRVEPVLAGGSIAASLRKGA